MVRHLLRLVVFVVAGLWTAVLLPNTVETERPDGRHWSATQKWMLAALLALVLLWVFARPVLNPLEAAARWLVRHALLIAPVVVLLLIIWGAGHAFGLEQLFWNERTSAQIF